MQELDALWLSLRRIITNGVASMEFVSYRSRSLDLTAARMSFLDVAVGVW